MVKSNGKEHTNILSVIYCKRTLILVKFVFSLQIRQEETFLEEQY